MTTNPSVSVFDFEFTVDAPAEQVAAFHEGTSTLKTLTPAYVQIHELEPLADGSVSKFTVWMGPVPIHWTAVHSNVTADGFTDSQAEGPMASWDHTHRFHAVSPTQTRVTEHIEYHYGSTTRDRIMCSLFFNRPALAALFQYRKFRTRRALRPA